MDIIAKIGAQWHLILILFSAAAVIYFRKEIKLFLSNKRITGIGGVSVDDTENMEKNEKIPDAEENNQQSNESLAPINSENDSEIIAKENEASFSNLFMHIMQEQFIEAKSMYEKLVAEATDETEITRINITFKYYLIFYGNQGSLVELVKYVEEVVKDPKILALGNYYIGIIHTEYNNFKEALSYLIKSQKELENNDDKVYCEIKMAICHSKLSGIEKGIYELRKSLSSFEKIDRAKIYEKLAEFYGENEDKEMQFFAMEMAHKENLHSTSYEFSCAYNAHNSGPFSFVRLHHYNSLLNKISTDDHLYDSVTNNRGVVFADLNLPGLCVDDYFKSQESGGTLATANLAYVLIGAGYYQLAEEILLKASKEKNPHENVWSAIQKVKKAKKDELEKFEKYSEIGRKVHLLTQKLAELKMSNPKEQVDLDGNWELTEYDYNDVLIRKDWANIEHSIEEKSITFNWEEKDKKSGFLKLEFSDLKACEATFSMKKSEFFSFNDYAGHGIITGNSIEIFVGKDQDVKFLRVTRISE